MDDRQFDALVKRVTQTRFSRLDAVRGVVASAAMGVTGAHLAAGTAARKRHGGKDKDGRKDKDDRKDREDRLDRLDDLVAAPCVNGTCADPDLACCKGQCVPRYLQCCPESSPRVICPPDGCCGDGCIFADQGDVCCANKICFGGGRIQRVCCNGQCHDINDCRTCCNNRCYPDRVECCGTTVCGQRQQCCNGEFCTPEGGCLPGMCGPQRVCGPNEQCCPGQQRCCRTDETCCNGRCCYPGQACQNGVCGGAAFAAEQAQCVQQAGP